MTRHRPAKFGPIFRGLGWRVTHRAIPAPRVYHGKVHVYSAVAGSAAGNGTAVRLAMERLLSVTGSSPLSATDLEAEDSGGSDDDTDEDDEPFEVPAARRPPVGRSGARALRLTRARTGAAPAEVAAAPLAGKRKRRVGGSGA